MLGARPQLHRPIPAGTQFGFWTVVTGVRVRWGGRWVLECRCRCGSAKHIRVDDLGKTRRCKACNDHHHPGVSESDCETMAELDALVAEQMQNLPSWWHDAAELQDKPPEPLTVTVVRLGRRHNGRVM